MNFGSLFAGGVKEHSGGFDIGFAQAGMIPKWEIEITRGKDIKHEKPEDYGAVDLICGGPPCIHTSTAAALSGSRTGESLWPEMLRFVKQKNPTWVVVEQPASTEKSWVRGVVEDLQRHNYGVAGRIIDSKHWVPQQRARWFIIGRLEAVGVELGDYLYDVRYRLQTGPHQKGSKQKEAYGVRRKFRTCSDCMPSGIYSRISKRKPALITAGNAVSIPVAKWLGERIQYAETRLR